MKFKLRKCIAASVAVMAVAAVQSVYVSANAAPGTTDIPISDKPLFVGANSLPVLVMLVLSRDHSMYSEAYTDASDVNSNGKIDYYFKPEINYYGLFRSDVCYEYKSGIFEPKQAAKIGTAPARFSYCDGSTWNGNFLNYVTTSRMDAVKKVVMGGERADLNGDQSVIRHTWIPYDAHSWGKSFVNDYYTSEKGYNPAVKVNNFVPSSELSIGQGSDSFGGAFFGVKNYDVMIGIPQTMKIGSMDEYGSKSSDTDRTAYMNKHAWIWNWASRESGDGILEGKADGASGTYNISSKGYTVQVRPCVDDEELRDKAACRKYTDKSGNSVYMPSGLIQQRIAQGAPDFGLITSGFEGGRNIGKGYIRGRMHDASTEIDPETGRILINQQDCSSGGYCDVLPTINMLGAGYFDNERGLYWDSCKNNRSSKFYMMGETCPMWGNPIGAMLYESYKYFNGEAGSTQAADTLKHKVSKNGSTVSTQIGYAKDVSDPWKNYNKNCQNAINLVLSSEDNSFDETYSKKHTRTADTQKLLQDITSMELKNPNSMLKLSSSKKFVVGGIYNKDYGWKGGNTTAKWADLPTLKPVTGLQDVWGIAPIGSEAEGTYFAAAAAYSGVNEQIKGTKNYLKTSVVAMAPSLPRFKIKNAKGQMEIVPVCVTPNGNRNANEYNIPYLQVCAPVDFYMDYIHYDDHSNPVDMSFRINFEDTESGKDYDEDVIVQYHMWFDNKDPAKAYVSVRGFYSDGYAPQHFGYTVTGVQNPDTFIDMAKSTNGDRGRLQEFNLIHDSNLDQATNKDYGYDTPVIVRESFNGKLLYQNRDFDYDGTKRKADEFPTWGDQRDVALCRSYSEVQRGLIPLIRGKHSDPVKCMPEVIRTFKVTGDADPAFLEPPVLLAARYGQDKDPDYSSEKLNITTGFYEPKNYFYVSNASTLASQIDKALSEIRKDTAKHVGSSAAFSSNDLSGRKASYYRANFEEAYWTGDIVSYQVVNGVIFADDKYINWKAGEQLAQQYPAQQYPADKTSSVEDRRNIFITDKDGNLHLFRVCDGGANADNSLLCMDDESYAAITARLRTEYAFTAGSDAEIDAAKEFVNYMFGDRSLETTEQGENPASVKEKVARGGYPATFNGFRNRGETGSLYGDIQDSTPVYGKTADGLGFVVFGGNDGMIHVISDKTGEELFAIIPHTIAVDGDAELPSSPIVEYAIPGYSHRFMVDGTVRVFPYETGTKESPKTHVLALGTYGKKFRGGYALDLSSLSAVADSSGKAMKVTNPDDIQKLYKWGFDATTSNKLVGCMPRAPQLFLHKTDTNSSRVYAVYGNGYNAPGDDEGNTSALLIVDVLKGKFVNNIVAKDSSLTASLPVYAGTYKNGMAEPTIYDSDSDGYVDYVYAGDLDGNLYRLNIASDKSLDSSSARAVSADDLHRIAVSYDSNHLRQSITTTPAVGVNPDAESGHPSVYVSWGTGRFLVAEDGLLTDAKGTKISRPIHSLYTIVDDFTASPAALTRDSEGVSVTQTKYDEEASTANGSENPAVRKISFVKTSPKGTDFKGLVVDLMPITYKDGDEEKVNEAEMVISNPQRNDRKFVVNTNSPTSDPCKSSAQGYQYELDLYALKNLSTQDQPSDYRSGDYGDHQKNFGGLATDVVITTTRSDGEVKTTAMTNVDVGEKEGKAKKSGKLEGIEDTPLTSESFRLESYQYILDNETPW